MIRENERLSFSRTIHVGGEKVEILPSKYIFRKPVFDKNQL